MCSSNREYCPLLIYSCYTVAIHAAVPQSLKSLSAGCNLGPKKRGVVGALRRGYWGKLCLDNPNHNVAEPLHPRLGRGRVCFGGGELARVGHDAGGVIDRAEVDRADLKMRIGHEIRLQAPISIQNQLPMDMGTRRVLYYHTARVKSNMVQS